MPFASSIARFLRTPIHSRVSCRAISSVPRAAPPVHRTKDKTKDGSKHTEDPNEAPRFSPSFADTLILTLQSLAIFIVLREHFLDVKWINGPSMSPYLNEGYGETNINRDMVLADVTYATKLNLHRGMVIIFTSVTDPKTIAVKRIIALPGDKVTTRPMGGSRYGPKKQITQLVPWNHVWVEGDANDSDKTLDSNTYGPISVGLIRGQVMCVLRPKPRVLKWWEWENEDNPVESGGEFGKRQRMRVEKNAIAVYAPPVY
ncbi:hypothetical protein FQN57_005741 [Myotisia sp. PD_48]|nr:hypothetical protein FQN57_005741 [Myotisia sp. PD_48]